MKWGMRLGLFLGIMLLNVVTPVSAGGFTHTIQEQSPEYPALLNDMLNMAFEQTQVIASSLDDLVLYVNKGSIKVSNPTLTREMILVLKRLITDITAPKYFSPASEDGIYTLLHINATLVRHISDAIDKGLNEFPQLNAEDFIVRKPYSLDFQELHNRLSDVSCTIEFLKNKVQNAGLTFINKGYRWLESCNNRLKIMKIALGMGCTTVGGLVALYMIPQEIFDKTGLSPNNPLTKLKNLLGEKAPFSQIGNETIVDSYSGEASGVLRILENTLGRSGVTYTGLGVTFALKDFLGEPFKKIVSKGYDKTRIGVLNMHHWLRGSNISVVDKDQAEFINYDQINANLVGLEWAKKELESAISYICEPDRYIRYGIPIPKGFLFTGPPGTGKTEFARWISAEINHRLKGAGKSEKVGFRSIAWHELISGDGIKEVIERGKREAPCIIFIDEIDTIGLQRDRWSQLLNEILQALSGLNNDSHDGASKIIFIGATNKPEHLDPAMRRSGRLGKEILFPLPDLEKRLAYFNHQQQRYALDPQAFDSVFLAKQTAGRSFADLAEICNTAALNAKNEERPLAQHHFQQALNSLNRLTDAKNLTPQNRKVMSTYIAGRITSHLILEAGEITCATILPYMKKIKEQNVYNKLAPEYVDNKRIGFGKVFVFDEQETFVLHNENDIQKQIQVMLAGHVAEELMLGKAYYSHHEQDKNKALELAMKLQARGLDLKRLPQKIRDNYAIAAQALVEKHESLIREQLNAHRKLIDVLAKNLEEKSIIYQNEIQELFTLSCID